MKTMTISVILQNSFKESDGFQGSILCSQGYQHHNYIIAWILAQIVLESTVTLWQSPIKTLLLDRFQYSSRISPYYGLSFAKFTSETLKKALSPGQWEWKKLATACSSAETVLTVGRFFVLYDCRFILRNKRSRNISNHERIGKRDLCRVFAHMRLTIR